MSENRCIVCDEIILGVKRVCPLCEKQQIKTGRILQSNGATDEEVKNAYDFMNKKGEKNG